MRTTVTLDPDTEGLLRRQMRARGVTFKQALNDAIRDSLSGRPALALRFETESANLGLPSVNLDRALQVAADLEDDEVVRKLRIGK